MPLSKIRIYLHKFIRLLLWIFVSILILLFFIIITLQFPPVQTYITGRITTWLSSQTGTVISVENLAVRFPKTVALRGIYVEDEKGDTLLYAGKLFADIRMTALLRNKVHINSLQLDDLTAHIKREKPDSVFNFQFIPDALASGSTDETKTREKENSLDLRINNVILSNLSLSYEDHHPGIRLNARLDHFQTNLGGSDLLNGKYHAGRTDLSGSRIEYIASLPSLPPEPSDSDEMEFDMSVNSININDLAFSYRDQEGGSLTVETSVLEIIPENIRLADYLIEIVSIQAENLQTSMIRPGQGNMEAARDEGISEEFEFDFSSIMEWTVKVEKINLINSYVLLAEEEKHLPSGEFDPANFSLGNFNLSAGNIYVAPDSMNLEIDSMSMLISESFQLHRFALDLSLGSSSGRITSQLQTDESLLGFEFDTEAGLLNFRSEELYDRHFHLRLDRSHINKDMAFFLPVMGLYYFNWPGTRGIEFGGSIHGALSRMTADSLWMEGPGFFTALVDGNANDLIDGDVYLDIEHFNFYAVPELFLTNLPDTLRPEGITMPDHINVGGRFTGTTGTFEASVEIQSNFGDIEITGSVAENTEPGNIFEGSVHSRSFDIGEMMQLEALPVPPSFRVDFSGRGSDPADMELVADITIGNLSVMEYSYQDIVISLVLQDSVISASTSYRDEFLALAIDAGLGIFTQTTFVRGDIVIDYADLSELGFYGGDLLVETEIAADIIFAPDDFFSGGILISNTGIASNGELHQIEEIVFSSDSRPGDYQFELRTGFFTANYKGNFTPFEIPEIVSGHLSGYFNNDDSIDLPGGKYEHFDLDLILYPHDLIGMFLPDLEAYDTLTVAINYDSRLQEITLEASIDDFRYSGMDFLNLQVNVESDPGIMDFGIYMDRISLNGTSFYDLELSGGFFEEVLELSFSVLDNEDVDMFFITALVEREQEVYYARFGDKFIINGEQWEFHPDNLIIAGTNFLNISDFIMEGQGSMLSVNTVASESYENVLEIRLRQIDLNKMTSFLENGMPPIAGILDGNMTIRDILSDPSFIADLNIENFSLSDEILGSVSLTAENPSPDNYYISLTARHEGTDVWVKGNYTGGEAVAIDMEIFLNRLNLAILENFAGGNVTDIGGFVTGNMNVTGTPDNPGITGELRINETSFRLPALNAGYLLRDETIRFENQNIRLQNFTLEDSQGRRAQLNGAINFPDLDNLNFDLTLNTRDFMLMNLPHRRGEMFHGRILMDSDLRLSGTHRNPSLGGRLRLNEGSTFTFVLPREDPEAVGDEGVVEFIAPGDILFSEMVADRTATDELTAPVEIMNIDLNIEIDRETILRLVIDELAGDFLEIHGGGVLNFGITPGGKITLSGRFDIDEGEYMLTFYDIVKRNFRIEPGSSILWTGDPLDAQLDIDAVYTIRTSPQPLMRAHAGDGQALAARYRQQFPFLVSLGMEGNLMNPDIEFGIDMPLQYHAAVEGTIKQRIDEISLSESELNKQVFALLILGSFIQENPLDFSGGPGIGATARSSASQMLTQQLNRMSDRYIRGLDISFELESYEDFTEGEAAGRTELQMEVSRDFLDERFRVTIGGNIELEDETRRETRPGDIAGDFSLEYLLNPEGSLIIRGFRKRDFGDLIERDVTETGISLKFTRSYNRFRELFRRKTAEPEFPELEEVVDEQTGTPDD
jgi:translocation and assembly module TamB